MGGDAAGGLDLTGLLFFVVPAVLVVVGIGLLVSTVRERRAVLRLSEEGEQAEGRVLSSRRVHSDVRVNGERQTHQEEEIGFHTARGETVRATPEFSDVREQDRTGQLVTVFYDPDRPDRFIAPENGHTLSSRRAVIRVVVAVGLIVVAGLVALVFVGVSGVLGG